MDWTNKRITKRQETPFPFPADRNSANGENDLPIMVLFICVGINELGCVELKSSQVCVLILFNAMPTYVV
jgi:hypothetical protein